MYTRNVHPYFGYWSWPSGAWNLYVCTKRGHGLTLSKGSAPSLTFGVHLPLSLHLSLTVGWR